MKNLVYPAVLFKDEEANAYTILVEDLGISTDGDTVEDAFIRAKAHLCAMVDCAIKFDCEIEPPTDFELVYKKHNSGKVKHIVLLVDALS